MLGFKEAKETVDFIIKTNLGRIINGVEKKAIVPIIVGDRGIGKTALASAIAKENNFAFFNIDGNLLKEGEIGGLPVVNATSDAEIENIMASKGIHRKTVTAQSILDSNSSYHQVVLELQGNPPEAQKIELTKRLAAMHRKAATLALERQAEANEEFAKQKRKYSRKFSVVRTVYAIHHVLAAIQNAHLENPEQPKLLFIDEINRCEHAVQQELMNLILNGEINGYKLPANVLIMAAQNPSAKFADFKDTTYQTVDMDEAQEDRLVWIIMGSDETNWLEWGSDSVKNAADEDESRIHQKVLEYIATNPEHLNMPLSTDDVKPSPRSWERVSDHMYAAERLKVRKAILNDTVKGNVGVTVGLAFMQFLAESDDPIITPEEIFQGKKTLTDANKNRIVGQSFPRQLVIIKNAIRYINNSKQKSQEMLDIFTKIITVLPKDLMVMVMMKVYNEHLALHRKLVESDEYLDAFHDVDQMFTN